MKPILEDGVLYIPKVWESPGIYGDGYIELEQDDPSYDDWLLEAVQELEVTAAAPWREELHPRDDEGQFTRKSGAAQLARWESLMNSQLEAKAEMESRWKLDERGNDFGSDYWRFWADENLESGGQSTLPLDWAQGHTFESDDIRTVDNIIRETRGIREDTAVWRGAFGQSSEPSLRPISTSFSKYSALAYADRTGGNKEDHLHRVIIPAGTKVGWHGGEDEVVLPTGTALEQVGPNTWIARVPPEFLDETMVGAGWDEQAHPRDPGGQDGGRWVKKGGGVADIDADWVDPPEPRGINRGIGGAGGYTTDKAESSMTSLGRTGEKLFMGIISGDVGGDVEIMHPEGAGEKSPLDVRADGWGFEVKTVSADATSFKATPKPHEMSSKVKAAKDLGLKGGIAIVVLDRKAGVARAYFREGFKGGRLSENTGWRYIGESGLTSAAWDESKHPRDPGGEGGGQFVTAETVEGDTPVMGLGAPGLEEKLRKTNAVPELVEQQMEADLKDFLDNASLNMRMPEEALLEALADDEFMNQHQAQNSRGMGRTVESEARMFGLPEGTPAEGLAKYGYLGPDHQGVIGYGPIKVVFKDNVKDRTTFTVNDSFMQGDLVMPSKVRDPSYLSANLGQIDEAAGSWASEQGIELDYGVGGSNLRYGAEPADFIPDGDMWHEAIANERTSIPYVEAQIYGKLTPADIDHVEVLAFDDWDLEDPNTGLPQVSDRATMEAVISRLNDLGIAWYEYNPPGDYSGEWA